MFREQVSARPRGGGRAPGARAPDPPLPAVWISLYYVAFYVVMTGVFALCIYVLMCTVDPYTPDYQDQLKSPGNLRRARLRPPLGKLWRHRHQGTRRQGAGVQHRGRSPGAPSPPRRQEASRPRAGVSKGGGRSPCDRPVSLPKQGEALGRCAGRGQAGSPSEAWGRRLDQDLRAQPADPG